MNLDDAEVSGNLVADCLEKKKTMSKKTRLTSFLLTSNLNNVTRDELNSCNLGDLGSTDDLGFIRAVLLQGLHHHERRNGLEMGEMGNLYLDRLLGVAFLNDSDNRVCNKDQEDNERLQEGLRCNLR